MTHKNKVTNGGSRWEVAADQWFTAEWPFDSLRLQLDSLQPGLLFHTPENIRKPRGFLFSGGIEKQHRAVMG